MQTFRIATVEDLVRVLDAHPQWWEVVRERLLPREVLDVPQQIAEFAADTKRRPESNSSAPTSLPSRPPTPEPPPAAKPT